MGTLPSIMYKGINSCTQSPLFCGIANLADLHVQADNLTDTELLFSSTTIADWIIPAIYMGHIGAVVWLKPPWASQISEGKHSLIVGKERSSGYIRLGRLTIIPPLPPPPTHTLAHTHHYYYSIYYYNHISCVCVCVCAYLRMSLYGFFLWVPSI